MAKKDDVNYENDDTIEYNKEGDLISFYKFSKLRSSKNISWWIIYKNMYMYKSQKYHNKIYHMQKYNDALE